MPRSVGLGLPKFCATFSNSLKFNQFAQVENSTRRAPQAKKTRNVCNFFLFSNVCEWENKLFINLQWCARGLNAMVCRRGEKLHKL